MHNTTFLYKKKQYIEVPLAMECSAIGKIWRGLVGLILLPFYLIAANFLGTPGIKEHVKCALIGLRLFLAGRISFFKAYVFICFPLDSTRYFELCEVLKSLAHTSFSKYLDVSSPRMVPLLSLMQNKTITVNILNPDSRDIEETKTFANALGLKERCTFTNSTIETANLKPETFDLITCISVLEHIPEDKKAVEVMWSLLRPGGRFILTLPCMANSLEQYISLNEYGVLPSGSDGYTFWQRFYDEERLQSVIFNTTGLPLKTIVYGEKQYGLFYRNASMKRLLGFLYPFWQESYMMGKEYCYFPTIGELKGEGVVMLEFVKK